MKNQQHNAIAVSGLSDLLRAFPQEVKSRSPATGKHRSRRFRKEERELLES